VVVVVLRQATGERMVVPWYAFLCCLRCRGGGSGRWESRCLCIEKGGRVRGDLR
jgi:hypothetical protein